MQVDDKKASSLGDLGRHTSYQYLNERIHPSKYILLYDCLCVCAFIGTAIWCVYTFSLDNDTCLVDYKLYNENPDYGYPSISILIINPFLDEKLRTYGDGINAVTYSKFLGGQHWDERMLDINYDDVTMDLKDYFIGYDMLSDNYSVISIDNFTNNPATSYGWQKPYKKFRAHRGQTFAVDPPFDTYGGVTRFHVQMWIKIKTNLFKDSLRPHIYDYNPDSPTFGGFLVWFHYPGQALQAWHLGMGKWLWPKRETNSSKNYVMIFKRSQMDVIQRRNKNNNPCVEDWKNHDQHVIEEVIFNAGCRPPHWTSKQNVPLCRSQEEMRKVLLPLRKHEFLDYTPPCRSITNLPFYYEEIDEDTDSDPAHFRIAMTSADTTFKNVEQIKEYSTQNLIGNIGGYLGLILGYAIVQLPVLLNGIYKAVHHICQKPYPVRSRYLKNRIST